MKNIKAFFMKNTPKRNSIIATLICMIIIGIVAICVSYNNGLNKEEQVAVSAQAETIDLEEKSNTIEEISIEQLEDQTNQIETIEGQNTDMTQDNRIKSNQKSYYIKVNYEAQVVTIYGLDDQGNYTKPVKAMVCSTGVYTPKSGVYKIPARWQWLGLQGDVYGHYATQIKGNILFHSVPYLRKGDSASLEYWEYDKLGSYASAGCVRLTVADAKWIFNNCVNGTSVEFYASSNPGPLGKPSAKKISNSGEVLRNWDPTDPDSNNPWRNQKEEVKENIIENKIENTQKQNQIPLNTNIQQNTTKVNEQNINKNVVTNHTEVITNQEIKTNTQIKEDNQEKYSSNQI